jgi:type II secretory pathway pseudopilin PulG
MLRVPCRTARGACLLPEGGFTIVEAVVATAIVAGMCVTALTTVAFSVRYQGKSADRAFGGMLAQAMIDEIMTQAYQDPNYTSVTLGPDPGESTTSRTNWNDVGDYNGWSESPLQNKDGSIIPNTAGWQRSVVVAWVQTSNPLQTSATETGCKRIIVTVAHNGITVATRTALRTNAP